MKSVPGISLKDVQDVYSGPEGQLWELIMGEQIHIGGLTSSMDLADTAALAPGLRGADLCCCTGAGMRFLVGMRQAGHMAGVDATETMVNIGQKRTLDAGFADRIKFVLSDACDTGLPNDSVDFVWGEDAWCYVENKDKLIAEAARIVKPGGTIAFTDWVDGGLSDSEADRFLRFMKFPNLESIDGYSALLKRNGCKVTAARDTGRFAPCIDLYINMLTTQLSYDALKIVGFNQDVMAGLGGEMVFTQGLGKAGKVAQALFVAHKNG